MRLLETPIYHLYLLQLESYELSRFLRAVMRRYFPPKGRLKKELVWTLKMRTVFFLSVLLHVLFIAIIGFLFPIVVFPMYIVGLLFIFISGFFLYFLWAALATLALKPFDVIIRAWLVSKARAKLRGLSKLKVIAITGSYGKTTMKETLYAVIGTKYKVVKTDENLNTPIGVARTILGKLTPETEIFIVEMGAHYRGDIKELCRIVPPDVAVITGINESHLERFLSIENTIKTKFEIVENARKDAKVLLNADDERVMENYDRYLKGREACFYSKNANSDARYKVVSVDYSAPTGAIYTVDIGDGKTESFTTRLLAGYVGGLISAVLQIGDWFLLSKSAVKDSISRLRPITHRLAPQMLPNNILIIDDSYNGNPEGVSEAIGVLRRFEKHRRVFVTPGLVEMGDKVREVHIKIGKQLAAAADLVVLIRNSVTPFIAEGLRSEGYSEEKIKWLGSGVEAFSELRSILVPGDVVLLQNDWPENYY